MRFLRPFCGYFLLSLFACLFAACTPSEANTEVGAECSTDEDCEEQCLSGLAGGFCTVSCTSHADCPRDTICGDTQGGVCLFPCEDQEDCVAILGEGFECEDETDFESEEVWVCLDE